MEAWNEYRAWAKTARNYQNSSQRWNRAALIAVILAAIFGALAATLGEKGAYAKAFAATAALASAIGVFLSRQILADGAEQAWVIARATAEAIKSECFRFAVKAPPYDSENALETFIEKRRSLVQPALSANISASPDPADVDDRRPPAEMTADWYLQNRIGGQTRFYQEAIERESRAYSRTRAGGIALGGVGAGLAALGALFEFGSAPWIGACTTIAAAIAAGGLLNRRRAIIATYSAMITSLGQTVELYKAGKLDPQSLVRYAEDLFASEHQTWLRTMSGAKALPD